MKITKVIIMNAYIDICVNKEKYNKYKRELSKERYVERILNSYMSSISGNKINGIELRDVSIQSNIFWGNVHPKLSEEYVKHKTNFDNNIVFRIFNIDLVGVIDCDINVNNCFFTLSKEDKYFLQVSSAKIR